MRPSTLIAGIVAVAAAVTAKHHGKPQGPELIFHRSYDGPYYAGKSYMIEWEQNFKGETALRLRASKGKHDIFNEDLFRAYVNSTLTIFNWTLPDPLPIAVKPGKYRLQVEGAPSDLELGTWVHTLSKKFKIKG